MRAEQRSSQLHVKAIAGTRVVLMAFKPLSEMRADLRGFAIKRGSNGAEPAWLTGIKFFKDTVPNPQIGQTFSSHDQPFQTFFWSYYAATPGTRYAFTIVPRYGDPAHLVDGEPVRIEVETEREDDGKHGIWFNRGVVASHKFAVSFQNKPLTDEMANDVDEAGHLRNNEASWLSRGLVEACLKYINDAQSGESLRVCAYEFTYVPVLNALKRAIDRGVDVMIIYHTAEANEAAITAAKLPAKALIERTRPQIPHNKFIIKLRGEKPKQVWTGSTNLTMTGFMGQTNVGHVVTDDAVAASYFDYWESLKENPLPRVARDNAIRLTPNPPNVIGASSTVCFYSPRIADNMLGWYGQRITDACSMAMITLPFNVAPSILKALGTVADSLRLVILENEPTKEVRDAERSNKGKLAFSNGQILGKTFVHNKKGGAKVRPISQGNLDDWFIEEELSRPYNKGHVFFLHSKVLLTDPLSDDPLVCTGSANFSTNSLISNDENMLLIRGDTRVADIYLTELDRVFKHFYDRDALNRAAGRAQSAEWLHLDTTPGWIEKNFRAGSYKHHRLMTFFPSAAPPRPTWTGKAARDPDPFADEAARAAARRKAKNAAARNRKAGGEGR